MGVGFLISLLCPRVFYKDYKAKIQQKKKRQRKLPETSKDSKCYGYGLGLTILPAME